MNGDLDLRAVLTAVFPPAPITREMIFSADARWDGYEERGELGLLEGKSWTELAPAVLEKHAGLLVHTGAALYRAILPAYLALLAEGEYATILPFHVVSQLTHIRESNLDRQIFEERVGPMSAEQRAAVARTLAVLAKQPPLRDVASDALRSW